MYLDTTISDFKWFIKIFRMRWNNICNVTRPRRYLEYRIFKYIRDTQPQRILFVGAISYTAWYHLLFDCVFETLDINPDNKVSGSPHGHYVMSVADADSLPASSYDVVVLNGVYGYGLNDRAALLNSLNAINHVLKPQGLFVFGWMKKPAKYDPLALAVKQQEFFGQFCQAQLRGRHEVNLRYADRAYCYQFFSKAR